MVGFLQGHEKLVDLDVKEVAKPLGVTHSQKKIDMIMMDSNSYKKAEMKGIKLKQDPEIEVKEIAGLFSNETPPKMPRTKVNLQKDPDFPESSIVAREYEYDQNE